MRPLSIVLLLSTSTLAISQEKTKPLDESERLKVIEQCVKAYEERRSTWVKMADDAEGKIRNKVNVAESKSRLATAKAQLAVIDKNPFDVRGGITEKSNAGDVSQLAGKTVTLHKQTDEGTVVEFGYSFEVTTLRGKGEQKGFVRCLIVPAIKGVPKSKVTLPGIYRVDARIMIDGQPSLALQAVEVKKGELPNSP